AGRSLRARGPPCEQVGRAVVRAGSRPATIACGSAVKLLFVGDVVGSPGRHAVESLLLGLRERHEPDFVVVNGENSAGGLGITSKIARGLYNSGVDAITPGNHTYRHSEAYAFLDPDRRTVRPANYPKGNPG